jgi:hypothetical protein
MLRRAGHYTGCVRTILAALALLLAVSSLTPALAQPAGAPTDCTEVTSGASIFIGHDCGEWASVVIVGPIVIRKPWSGANAASRAVRIRAARTDGASEDARPPQEPKSARTPKAKRTPQPTHTPKPKRTPEPSSDTTSDVDVSGGRSPDPDCKDFRYQEDAQEYFDAHGWSQTDDPYGLDQGGQPGVPCEDLPHRP